MATPLTLKVFRGTELLRTEVFNREIIKIGRLATAHLSLDDDRISRVHAVIEVSPEGAVSIIDMGSAEGTLVNGKKVTRCQLRPGDAITLGGLKVVLELGGNAACIVDEGADLDVVVPRLAFGAYYQSGQSCISVQRILAHDSIADALEQKISNRAKTLVTGDPKDDETFIGPVISEKVEQVYVPVRVDERSAVDQVSRDAGVSVTPLRVYLTYEPAALGSTVVHFADRKRDITVDERRMLVAPVPDGPGGVDCGEVPCVDRQRR